MGIFKKENKSEYQCESCNEIFQFNQLTFIKKWRKGISQTIQVEGQLLHINEIFICNHCRNKKEFDYWRNGKISIPKLRLIK